MKCPYCAEQIQDEAVLCRFCGARRSGNAWREPGPPSEPRGGSRGQTNITIATTGLLLLLSGAWSLSTLTSPVPLFGAQRTGLVALLCNSMFAALFLGMGYALVRRRPWALSITWGASLLYTLEKLELILDPAAQEAILGETSDMLGDLAPMVQQVSVLAALLFLLGWWSFVVYLYLKRAYFRPDQAEGAEPVRVG